MGVKRITDFEGVDDSDGTVGGGGSVDNVVVRTIWELVIE